jgi:hypothetical protein
MDYSFIQVFKFIGFVSVIKAIRVIITLNEYAKEREALSEWQGCPGHEERKLCSLIRLSCDTDFVLVRAL